MSSQFEIDFQKQLIKIRIHFHHKAKPGCGLTSGKIWTYQFFANVEERGEVFQLRQVKYYSLARNIRVLNLRLLLVTFSMYTKTVSVYCVYTNYVFKCC